MKILYLSRWLPYPTDTGVKLRLFHLIKALAEFHTVDLISFCTQPPDYQSIQPLASICRQIETVQYQPFNPNSPKALLGLMADKPRFLIDTYSAKMVARIETAVKQEKYDLVVASEIDMAPYAEVLHGKAVLFEGPEISAYLDELNTGKLTPSMLRKQATWWKLSGYLRRLSKVFPSWAVVSEQERRNLMKISPELARAQVIPNGADFTRKPSRPVVPHQNRLIYAGSLTYQANFDAVYFFLDKIFPLVLQKHPEVKFYVTGSYDKVNIDQLPASPNLILTGNVSDISAAVAESWVSVVPLRKGSGTRLKILESLSLGTPVVSTYKGSEGLDLVPGVHILNSDDPSTFAAHVIQVLENPDYRARLGRQGGQQVRQKYDWNAIGINFRQMAEDTSHRFSRTRYFSYTD